MTTLRKLKALMWKNFNLRYRRERLFLLELGVPLLLGPIYYVVLANIMHLYWEISTFLPNNNSFLSPENLQGQTVNYIPKSEVADTLMKVINASGATIRGFSGFREYLEHSQRYPYLPLIVFRDMDNSNRMPRKLRFQMLDQNYTLHLESLHQGRSSSEELFENPAIAATQLLVTEAFINYWKLHSPKGAGETGHLEIGLHKMHHSGKQASPVALANLFSSIIICSCIPISVNIIKEIMKLHRVSEAVYWLSWYLVGVLGFLLIEMVFFFVIVVAKVYNMYVATNLVVITLLVIVYATNSTSFCFLMASLIVNEATRTYVVILVAPFILYLFASASLIWLTETLNVILGFCVFQVAFCMSVLSIVDMEHLGRGYQFSNLIEEPSSSDSTSLFTGLLLMVLNTLFNLSCMWYFNKIQPTRYSEQNSFLLCFQLLESPQMYRIFSDKYENYITRNNKKEGDERWLSGNLKNSSKQVKWIEPGSRDYIKAIQLHNIVKYSQNDVIVTETSLDIYTELITVILGPHGADKSALIGMITGLMRPTQGTIVVHGYNVLTNKIKAQENIGLCPRPDILYKMLTCLEHLSFFYKLKGIEVGNREILEVLTGIQLVEKAQMRTVELSEYERRLLSLAIATIGDPKVVIMDEPSKGLNLAEQRELWSFLKTLKSNRAILVTTSSVNEAEALADWTAVVIDGDVKCYGSQAFLKYKYGVGYQLSVVKKPDCRADRVTAVVRHVVTTACLQEESNKELHYFLPHDAVGKFSKLLFNLESHADKLGVESVGIYNTTMDEVFARVQLGYDPSENVLTVDVDPVDDVDPEESAARKERRSLKKARKGKRKRSRKSNINENSSIDDKQDNDNSDATEKINNMSKLNWLSSSPADMVPSNTSLGSRIDPARTDSRETVINMEMSTSSSLHILDEYVFKKEYTLNPNEMSESEKMKAICMKSILIAKRSCLITVLRTGMPSLLLIASLLLDMHGHFSNQALSIWYTLDNVPQSSVPIVTDKDTDAALVDIYVHLIPASHTPLLIKLDSTIQKREEESTNDTEEQKNSMVYVGVDFSNKLYRHGIAEYGIKFHHTMSISLQMLLNAHVRRLLGHDYSVNSGLVTVEYLQDEVEKILCPTTALGLNLGLVIFSVVTISALIRDRRSGGKDLLELYGVTPLLYWLSTFAWDMAVYTTLVVCIMVIFSLDKVVFIDDGRWIVLLMILYLSAAAFFSEIYILQKFFDVPTHGITFIVILHIFTGVCGSFTLLFWDYTRSEPEYLQDFLPTLNIVLEVLSPLYSYAAAILPFPALVTVLRSQGSLYEYIHDIEFNGVILSFYRPLIVLFCQSLLFWAIVLLTDTSGFQQLSALRCNIGTALPTTPAYTDMEDEDLVLVRGEVNLAVLNNSIFEASLVLQDLRKCYGNKVAVEGTYLILRKGDCFGLLGPSGSGKSATLRMITGIEPVTSGSAYVKGYSIEDYLSKVRTMISFTPQHNILSAHLTGRETLVFYGRLRGIPDAYLHKEVDCLLNLMTLQLLADYRVASYGISKKRLLSIAIGFLGHPVLVILDEPSSGLDIEEKKALWSMMRKVTESESTVLFTTESVEECETVCTNMAIQVSGKLKCLGSPSHLTSRYAVGYTIILYLHPESSGALFVERLIEYMKNNFPGTTVSERSSEELRFRVRHTGEKLHEIFYTLKGVKKKFHLKNYMVHETTLEQVYLSFTLGYHVKPVKLIPIKKTVTWAEGTIDTVNTLPNRYSEYQNQRKMRKPSITQEDVAKYFKNRFSLSQPGNR